MTITHDEPRLTLNEELALPFLQTAVEIDQARQNPADHQGLIAVLANNAMLWSHLRSQFSRNDEGLSAEAISFLGDMTRFMIKSTILLSREADQSYLDKLVQINLHMCEQLLSLTATHDTVGTA